MVSRTPRNIKFTRQLRVLSLFFRFSPPVPVSSCFLNQFPFHVSTLLQLCFPFSFFCFFIYLLPGPSYFLSTLYLSPTFIFVFYILISSSLFTFHHFNLYLKLRCYHSLHVTFLIFIFLISTSYFRT